MQPLPKQLPSAVLFACTHNMIRSPMAEGLMKSLFPNEVYVDSCGVNAGSCDGFVISVMDELGIDMSSHRPKNFGDLDDDFFDLVICFSDESHAAATAFAHAKAINVLHWPVFDAGLVSDNRDERLTAYREVRDIIKARLEAQFGKCFE